MAAPVYSDNDEVCDSKMHETDPECYTTPRAGEITTDDEQLGYLDFSLVPLDNESIPTDLCGRPQRYSPAVVLANITSFCDGKVTIDFPGNTNGPCSACSTIPLRNLKDEVLIVLMPDREPVIIGQVYSSIPTVIETENPDVLIKGRRIRIESESEFVLIAGSSKIHLDARGKAVISADQIVSRARATNKVQGGSVQIN